MANEKLGIYSEYDKRIEELEQILTDVMREVDIWTPYDALDLDEVGRAKAAIKRINEVLERKADENRKLARKLDMSDKKYAAAEFLLKDMIIKDKSIVWED